MKMMMIDWRRDLNLAYCCHHNFVAAVRNCYKADSDSEEVES